MRKMLEPDPRQRYAIEEVLANSWIKSIEVCHEQEKPKHIHGSAKAMEAQYSTGGGNH
jgi:protein-serine/threonine kinase